MANTVYQEINYFLLPPKEAQERRGQSLEYLGATTTSSTEDVLQALIEKVRQLETELATLRDAYNSHNPLERAH